MSVKLFAVVMVVALVLFGGAANAKRLGNGGPVGKQSDNVTRSTAPATPAPGNHTTAAQPAPGLSPAAAAPAHRPWASALGGVAAGLGLAWLAHSLGLGEAFGQVLLVLVVVLALVLLWRLFKGWRGTVSASGGRLAFQGAAMPGVVARQPYRPENVGNDASARPFERSGYAAPTAGTQNWGIPEGFDTQGFLAAAKANFVSLQSAWDRSDIPSLRAMMTDSMLGEIKTQLAERENHATAVVNQTEVVMIDARLLGIEELPREYMASVEFSGMIREDPYAGPSPFREVWNMTKPRTGGGWLVAGVQALQ